MLSFSQLFSFAGCASINTTAYYLPGAASKQYAQVAEIAATPGLRLRVAAESSFARAAVTLGVRGVAGVSLFMTGRTYTDSAFVASLREGDFGGAARDRRDDGRADRHRICAPSRRNTALS